MLGVTYESLTSSSNEAVVLAGLHGSFLTENPDDDLLGPFLERVAKFEQIVNHQREVARDYKHKHKYILKSMRAKFFKIWDLCDVKSSDHSNRSQREEQSGRYGVPQSSKYVHDFASVC